MNEDEMRLKNTLSHEVHVTQTSQERRRLRALNACSQVVQLACVCVRVIVLVVGVVCVMLVLIARVVVLAVNNNFRSQFFCSWRKTLYINDPTVTKQLNSENHASNKCPNHFFIKFP